MSRALPSLLLIVTALYATPAHADGCASAYEPVRERWTLLGEPRQSAVILIEEERETLLLDVHLENDATPETASQLVWLTPIPAPAAKTEVDILRGMPAFSGHEPAAKVSARLGFSLLLASLTQLYPLPFLALFMVGAAGEGIVPIPEPATVHQQIERDGVELQLLSAPSAKGLAAHLRDQSVDLPWDAIEALGSYTGDSGCFVLFRIADLVTYRRAIAESRFPLGIFARFPISAGEGFFPLTASAVVPSPLLEVRVTVPGFVRAVGDRPAAMETTYRLGRATVGPEVAAAIDGALDAAPIDYTQFSYLGPPEGLSHDLRFEAGAPLTVRIASSVVGSSHAELLFNLFGVLLFFALSIVAAQVARLLWAGDTRPTPLVAVGLGAANALTIIGVAIAAYVYAKRQGQGASCALKFTAATSGIFCALLGILAVAL